MSLLNRSFAWKEDLLPVWRFVVREATSSLESGELSEVKAMTVAGEAAEPS